MRALRFETFGGIGALNVVDLPDPRPGSGEVVVRVRAASVNPGDAKNVEGRMEGTTLPRTPGRDFAGTVVVGPPQLRDADVWGTGGDVGFTRDGSHAELMVVPADGVRPKPASLSFEEAACVGVTYVAAWLGLSEAAAFKAGETVLVTGAAGGVGRAVTQIAKWLGGRTIGLGRDPLAEPVRRQFGIDHYLVADAAQEPDRVIHAVHELTGGRGVQVTYDTVGGPLFEPSLRCLAPLGRLVAIASAGTRRVSFDLLDFYHRRLRLFGVDTRAYDTRESARILEHLAPGFETGALKALPVARRFALDQATDAYSLVVKGGVAGKVVFVFPDA